MKHIKIVCDGRKNYTPSVREALDMLGSEGALLSLRRANITSLKKALLKSSSR